MTAASSTGFFHACTVLIAVCMTNSSLGYSKMLFDISLFLSRVGLLSITDTSCVTKIVHIHTVKPCMLLLVLH